MAQRCGSCAGNRTTNPNPNPAAVDAGSSGSYEVIDASGRSTGRKFDSLLAAAGYARRLGGTTKPV